MIISLSAVPSEPDKEAFLSEFNKFGKCSIDFEVITIKETHTVVSFVNEKNAQKAFDSLNKSVLCDLKLDLTLLGHKPEGLDTKTPKTFSHEHKKVSPDIEILIPSKTITFGFSSNTLLTPTGSYYSPTFPELYQESIESPSNLRESINVVYDESPLSVIRLPADISVWDARKTPNLPGNINEINRDGDDSTCALYIPVVMENNENRVKRKRIRKGIEKANEFFVCTACGRSIKRGSTAAHNKSKVHLLNLKMG